MERSCSIDIGLKNTGIYIEEYDTRELEKLKFKKTDRYTSDLKQCTEKYREWMNNVFSNGKCIYINKCCLSSEKGTTFDLQNFINLSSFLDSIKNEIDLCSKIVIEMQLSKNPMCCRLEQHIISWLTINYKKEKEIIIFGAQNKTRVIGCPNKMINKKTGRLVKITKTYYKKWSCEVASQILKLRKDMQTYNFIFNINKEKQDDLSDVIVQLQAFKIKRFVDKLIR